MLKVLVPIIFLSTCSSLKSDVGLHPIEMIQNHGYPAELHHITTEDGYILTYHRIPSKTPKPAILLHHGLFSSSAGFVNMGNRSMAFFLADAGYDVWLGNARGNAFCRGHVKLDPHRDSKKFFDFSWHEIGYYDLPAAIDYILNVKKDNSLYYVGFSQGSSAFLVMGSTRPEYNHKIRLAHLLAPSAITQYAPNRFLTGMTQGIDGISQGTEDMEVYEIPYTNIVREIGPQFCLNERYKLLCETVFTLVIKSQNVDLHQIPVLLTNFPSNAAVKQVVHYAQLAKSGKFQKFDYGKVKNLKVYGSEEPPLYDLSKVTAPVALYYGAGDSTLSVKDVQTLKGKLPNVVLDYLVPRKTFNHYDFLLAKDVVPLLLNKLLDTNLHY